MQLELRKPLPPDVTQGEIVDVPTWHATFSIYFEGTKKAGEFSGRIQQVTWHEDVPDEELCPEALVTVKIWGQIISIERRNENEESRSQV